MGVFHHSVTKLLLLILINVPSDLIPHTDVQSLTCQNFKQAMKGLKSDDSNAIMRAESNLSLPC